MSKEIYIMWLAIKINISLMWLSVHTNATGNDNIGELKYQEANGYLPALNLNLASLKVIVGKSNKDKRKNFSVCITSNSNVKLFSETIHFTLAIQRYNKAK